MPRLLLVDDNPSIHRIAESLLAPTDVELVCVDSAAEALDRIARGERFDVALVDTAMPGMDGWALLGRLRSLEETARLPIALMAGVLDPVDPAKLAQAPVQGFLKKPIELRELGDRVKALLAMPVAPAPAPAPFSAPAEPEPEPFGGLSPFSTVPATSTRDLARLVEPDLPEFRPEPSIEVVAPPLEAMDDLLVLTAEDLWIEESAAAEVAPPVPEVHLELEELDLDSLRGLAAESPAPESADLPPAVSEEVAEPMALADLGDFDALPGDLDLALPPAPPAEAESPALPQTGWEVPEAGIEALADLIGAPSAAPVAVEPEFPPAAPEPSALEPSALEPEPAPVPVAAAAAGQPPAASGQTVAAPAGDPQALIQALLADPVLVDALVRAVVARMGDQVIREIAWEVMPDLAGRLQK